MNNIEQEIQTIQKNLKGVKNPTIRKRALMILRGLQKNNVKLASDTYGVSRQTYYFWLERLREANYDLKSLLNQSNLEADLKDYEGNFNDFKGKSQENEKRGFSNFSDQQPNRANHCGTEEDNLKKNRQTKKAGIPAPILILKKFVTFEYRSRFWQSKSF